MEERSIKDHARDLGLSALRSTSRGLGWHDPLTESSKPTHTFMDAKVTGVGKFFLQPRHYELLYEVYLRTLQSGCTLFMVELADPTRVPLILDLDIFIFSDEFIANEQTLAMHRECVGVILRVFPSADQCEFRYIITASQPSEPSGGTIKIGHHVNVRSIITNTSGLLALRYTLVGHMNVVFPTRMIATGVILSKSFGDTFDLAVAKNPSQRMLGSSKIVKCKCPASKGRKHCSNTKHRNWMMNAGRRISLFTVLGPDGEVDSKFAATLKADLAQQLQLLSLLVPVDTPLSICEAPRLDDTKTQENEEPLGAKINIDVSQPGYEIVAKWLDVTLPAEPTTPVLQWHEKYGVSAQLQDMYCNNVGRPHTSSSSYIIISDGYLRRRCHSNNGSCPKYELSVQVPVIVYRALLGHPHAAKREVVDVWNLKMILDPDSAIVTPKKRCIQQLQQYDRLLNQKRGRGSKHDNSDIIYI